MSIIEIHIHHIYSFSIRQSNQNMFLRDYFAFEKRLGHIAISHCHLPSAIIIHLYIWIINTKKDKYYHILHYFQWSIVLFLLLLPSVTILYRPCSFIFPCLSKKLILNKLSIVCAICRYPHLFSSRSILKYLTRSIFNTQLLVKARAYYWWVDTLPYRIESSPPPWKI